MFHFIKKTFKKKKDWNIILSEYRQMYVVSLGRHLIKRPDLIGAMKNGTIISDFSLLHSVDTLTDLTIYKFLMNEFPISLIGFFVKDITDRVTAEDVNRSLELFIHNMNADLYNRGGTRNYCYATYHADVFPTKIEGYDKLGFVTAITAFNRNIYEKDPTKFKESIGKDIEKMLSITSSVDDSKWEPNDTENVLREMIHDYERSKRHEK